MTLIDYVWPCIITSGAEMHVCVCVYSRQPQQRSHVIVRQNTREERNTILESDILLPEAGFSTLRFNFTPQHAGVCLQLALQVFPRAVSAEPELSTRRPSCVPLLALPHDAAIEISTFFDNQVKTQITSAQQRNERALASAGPSASGIEQQNALVGKVYRHQILPMLLDMQAILQDAPYHELRAACARLAPRLHSAHMYHCISVLREVIRGHNDFQEDLLAVITPHCAPNPVADKLDRSSPLPRLRIHEGGPRQAATAPLTKVSPELDNITQIQPLYHSSPVNAAERLDLPAPSWDDLQLLMQTADDEAVAAAVSGDGNSSDEPASEVIPGSPFVSFVARQQQQHQAAGAANQQQQAAGAGGWSVAQLPPWEGMPDADDELEALLASLEDATDNQAAMRELMLTSFVPVQHHHIAQDPLRMLVDPDCPPSAPISTATSVVGSIVAANQGQRPSSVFTLQSARTSLSRTSHCSSQDYTQDQGLLFVGGSNGTDGTCYWSPMRNGAENTPFLRRSQGAGVLPPRSGPHASSHGLTPSIPSPATASDKAAGAVGACSGPAGAKQLPLSFSQALACSWRGFSEPEVESQYRQYWTGSCWVVDAATLGVTCALLLSQAAGLADSDMLVALAMPLLLAGFVLLLAQGQAAYGHRETVVIVSRLVSCVMLVASMRGYLDLSLAGRRFMRPLTTRLALAHLSNVCRPLLLWPAMFSALLEAVCLASLAPSGNLMTRVAEMTATCLTTVAFSAVLDAYARQAFASMHSLTSRASNLSSRPDQPGCMVQ